MPLQPPPRDHNDKVVPHDHADIKDADTVIRRISENLVVPDGAGGRRISSMAFKVSDGEINGMSVDIEALILELGIDPKIFVTTPRWLGSVKFEVKQIRDLGFMVGYDPLEDNVCHGEVWGNFTAARVKHLQRMATWYVEIEGVSLAK